MQDTRAIEEDAGMARRLGHGVCDRKAFMRAVQAEGREVLSDAGKGWWDDQKRLFPHLGKADAGQSLNGRGSRFGKASYKFYKKQWHKWNGTEWVPCRRPKGKMRYD